ncbi:hypothetical protein OS175_12450 [Marinicella sp. S1101]|uniref:hypothetical protein n=1 Tax=Marinicella marina TaxID=2996016 RepID=UPI002260ADFE|nr:hypothetical protein [Marinicella marina]MCX7554692.1 hypothetical protein [Marinicella marina]MDJ1141492.1 hypothetical protein [Marinicella marina]
MANEMRFNDNGKLIPPDQAYLEQAMKDETDGYPNDAMRMFIKAAELGNPYAQAAIAYKHLKKEEMVKALAWFQLVDLNMIDNGEGIEDLITSLENNLTAEEKKNATNLLAELIENYGKAAALENREKWRNNIRVGGSRIKGHIPSTVKIYSGGRITIGKSGLPEIFVSPDYVPGDFVRTQLHQFTYEYEFRFTNGRVKLNDIEVIESEN